MTRLLCADRSGRIFTTRLNIVEFLEWDRTFSGFLDEKILVSRDLKIERFAVEKWFLLFFLYLTVRSH